MNPMLTQEIGFFLSSSTAMRIAAVNSLFFGFCKGPSWPGKKKKSTVWFPQGGAVSSLCTDTNTTVCQADG